MDEIRIESGIVGNVVSKLLEKWLRKKLGAGVGIRLNKLYIKFEGGKAYAHLDADAELEQEDVLEILKKAGLGGKE